MKNRIIAFSIALIVLTTCIVIPASAASKSEIAVLDDLNYFYSNPENWSLCSYVGTSTAGNELRFACNKHHTYAYAIPRQTRATTLQYELVLLNTEDFRFGYMSYNGEGYTGYTPSIFGTTPVITYQGQELHYWGTNAYDSFENADYIIDTNSPFVKLVNSLEEAAADYLTVQPTIYPPYIVPDQQSGEQIYNTLTENITYRAYSSTNNVYAILLKNIYNLGDRVMFYTESSSINLQIRRPSGNYSESLSYLPNQMGSYYYYIYNPNSNYSTCSISYIPIYDCNGEQPNIADILNWANRYTQRSLTYSLPSGNAIIIEYGTAAQYSISVNSGPYPSPHTVNGIRTGYLSSISSIDINSFDEVLFTGTGKTNIIGNYSNFYYTGNTAIESGSNDKYLVIINPSYPNGFVANVLTAYNPAISINCSNVKSFNVIPLQASIQNGAIFNEVTDENIIGQYDTDTGEWITVDENGNPITPSSGGMNISGQAKTITEWLSNIAEELSDFFRGPINAVQVLVSNLQGFVNSIKSLYTWLPAPVYSLLTSAILVAITIGVIKIFI